MGLRLPRSHRPHDGRRSSHTGKILRTRMCLPTPIQYPDHQPVRCREPVMDPHNHRFRDNTRPHNGSSDDEKAAFTVINPASSTTRTFVRLTTVDDAFS